MIEQRTGRTVREIFAGEGEDAFRAMETEVLVEALASPTPSIIAGAGGVVLREENRVALRQSGARVIWLCADPATLAERVKSGGHRPLLDGDAAATLQRMFRDREAFYREVADAIVLVDNRSVGEVVEAVLR
jgi:shikimate kinase